MTTAIDKRDVDAAFARFQQPQSDYPNAPPWIAAVLEDEPLIKAHRKLEFDAMVKRIEDEPKQPTDDAFKDLGDGWFRRGDIISKYESNVLTVLDLAEFRNLYIGRFHPHEQAEDRD